jgi:hypothetical protein
MIIFAQNIRVAMNAEKPQKDYPVLKAELTGKVCEPVAVYSTTRPRPERGQDKIIHSIYGELHTHEEVFREFAGLLNAQIGTNITF